jgi:hypothetical protein
MGEADQVASQSDQAIETQKKFVPQERRISLIHHDQVPSGTIERSPPRERWVCVSAEGQAPEGRHNVNRVPPLRGCE